MFRNAKDLAGYTVTATDGEAGTLINFLFDEDTWTVRYLVVRTGNWFLRQLVLVSPIALRSILDPQKSICLREKKSRLSNSPLVNMNRPIPRSYEERFYSYYGWPAYWGGKNRWGDELYPSELFNVAPVNTAPIPPEEALRDTGLRSTGELEGFAVFGTDGKIGTVRDAVISDRNWEVRFLLVDAADIGKGPVPLSPHWLSDVSLSEKTITADVSTRDIATAPPYPGTEAITRDDEIGWFKHYGHAEELDAVRVRPKVLA